ncbi:MAG: hypothetical protein V7L05_03475 [Nostoc sp.]|uniref:hypothetical protein n=1 Tax=Nostoc sp. TaxID=1180 RepID=UPI002FFABF1D
MEVALSAKGDRQSQKNFGSLENPAYPQIFTVTDLPDFFSWGSEQRLVNIVENYIGLTIAFQGVHLRRDFANKACVTSFPVSRLGMYSQRAAASGQEKEAEPPRVGSQPGGWEPVRVRAVS